MNAYAVLDTKGEDEVIHVGLPENNALSLQNDSDE